MHMQDIWANFGKRDMVITSESELSSVLHRLTHLTSMYSSADQGSREPPMDARTRPKRAWL